MTFNAKECICECTHVCLYVFDYVNYSQLQIFVASIQVPFIKFLFSIFLLVGSCIILLFLVEALSNIRRQFLFVSFLSLLFFLFLLLLLQFYYTKCHCVGCLVVCFFTFFSRCFVGGHTRHSTDHSMIMLKHF